MTDSSSHRRPRAFTLIEILVVIGIIVLIMGIALPALVRTLNTAKKVRGSADLAAVSTAIEAFKTDHGDIPRPAGADNTGFAVLGRSLVGPGGGGQSLPQGGTGPYFAGQCVSTGSGVSYQEFVCVAPVGASMKYETPSGPPGAIWTQFAYSDGKDGPGIKIRSGGQSFGPYLEPSKFKTRGVALLDGNDNPILYFPARPGKVAQVPGWILLRDSIADAGTPPVYNAADNISFFLRHGVPAAPESAANNGDRIKARQRMEALLVSSNSAVPPTYDGVMQANEVAATTIPYLLWAAGADGVFGAGKAASVAAPTPADAKDCDDVTNFKQ